MLNHELIGWLQAGDWHYCLRNLRDVLVQGARRASDCRRPTLSPEGRSRVLRQCRLVA